MPQSTSEKAKNTNSYSDSESVKNDFIIALKELSKHTASIKDPHIRVKIIQWIRKLTSKKIENNSQLTQKDQCNYIQYLNIIVKSGLPNLLSPFNAPPTDGDLVPLEEIIINAMTEQIPELPRAGPIQPIFCHKSENGRAIMQIKKGPEGEILCYMSVIPDKLSSNQNN